MGYRPPANSGYVPLSIPSNYPPTDGEHKQHVITIMRGLPFRLDGDARVLLLGEEFETETVIINVAIFATHLIFAHRLNSSLIEQGGLPGQPIADLVFMHGDGTKTMHTIRERFEVAVVPSPYGERPFLARPDTGDSLPTRWEGRFESAGERQKQVVSGKAELFFLWVWTNPRPDTAISQISIQSRGASYALGAITASTLTEPPFSRTGVRDVQVSLRAYDEELNGPSSDLHVEVDRGDATFLYPALPWTEGALADNQLAGFGDDPIHPTTSYYCRVAASPSATVSLITGAETLGSFAWSDITAMGAASDKVRIELVDSGRNWVRTTIVDDATDNAIPCRVHFRSIHGIPYPPHGHHEHVNGGMLDWHQDVGGDVRLGATTYAYVDGECEGWLPRGDVVVDVARGFDYEPYRRLVRIEPGQQALRIRLKRISDPLRTRWFAGDTHVHFLSSQGAVTEGRAEGLSVINLLLSQWGHLFTGAEEFTGKPHISSDGQTIVYASQENRQHILGHLSLLGLKRHVMPWCTDGPHESYMGGTLETTLAEWADRCHEQGGWVVIPHLPVPNGEPAALIATGRVDAVEWVFQQPTDVGRPNDDPYYYRDYYRYLNGGYRLPLAGGTDKMSGDVPVGLCRTYVNIPKDQEFSFDQWCKNLAAGRTYVTTGPLVHFTVDGAIPGDTVHLRPGGGTIHVNATVESIFPIKSLELVERGRVVSSRESAEGTHRMVMEEELTVHTDSWLAIRVGGERSSELRHRDNWRRPVMAHSSPVYIACGAKWSPRDPATMRYMSVLIDGSLAYIQQLSRQFADDEVTHHHGRTNHLEHLERPFLEAKAALRRWQKAK